MSSTYTTLIIFALLIACSSKTKGIECSKCRAGDFIYYYRPENETIEIKRSDSLQIEKNLKSGFITKSKVRWLSECEFESIYISSTDLSIEKMADFMKSRKIVTSILEVNNEYYLSESKIQGMSLRTRDTTWFKK